MDAPALAKDFATRVRALEHRLIQGIGWICCANCRRKRRKGSFQCWTSVYCDGARYNKAEQLKIAGIESNLQQQEGSNPGEHRRQTHEMRAIQHS